MATAIRNSSFVCLILNLVVCVVQFLPVTYSKNILTVPHSAAPGYLVSRIACSRPGVKIKLFGHNADEFYDKFIITASGKLVVKTGVFSDINKLYYISTFENNRCFDNVQKHNNFIINITNTKDIVHFTKRQYSGIVSHSDVGNALLGLNEIRFSHDKSVPVSEIQFSLEGGGSELFSIESISPNTIQIRANHDITVPYTKVYHFTLTAKVRGHTAGGSDVVVVLDDIAGSNINQGQDNKNVANFEQNALPGESKNIFRKGGDDGRLGSGHRRVRRQTFGSSSQTITLDETATGRLFAIDPALPSGTTFKFNLTSALPENVFSVDNEGNVSLRAGEKLDYDFGPKTYTINLDVLNSNDQVIKTIVVTLNLNNVNDENPYFITKPLPYLAAIPETAEAALKVFQLQAVDPDQGSVVYYIEGVNDLFDVQINTGWIVTTRQITSGTDFKVKVYAEDSSASTSQKTPTVTVEIRRGFRKPQFLSESYVAAVEEVNQADQTMTQTSFETTDKQGNKVKIEAINFQEKLGGTIQYTVYENTQTKSTKFAVENGNLKTLQPLDYESGSHQFQLTIMALDTHSGLTNLAQLEVNVVDKNEYDPLFSKSTYTATVQETLPLNSNVTTVMATDRDSNTRISYSVTNPLFSVKTYDNGQTGVIVVNGQLDYDKTPGNRYEFDIIATDNGQNPFPRNATARVVVYITNVNDQDPKFDDNLVTTLIDNTVGGSTVIVVRATDEDGDGVKYTFEGKSNVRDLFQIDEITGKITLQADRTIPSGTDQYRLPVVATDDGSCCGGVKIRSSTTTVVINIIDAVNIKPSFERCSDYKPEVLEGQEPGAYVTQVNAKDTNRGENGVVEYYIIQDSKNTAQFFSINKTTGQLVTKEKLDRETQTSRNLFITVRAVDKGQPPLDDYCTFPITVGDVNDNDPVFTATQYSGRILKAASVGENVLTVKANDNDLGLNANILYSLSTNPGDYFSIDRDTGVISVAKSLTPTGSSVSLIAMATDGGTPSRSATVAVSITISTDPNVLPPSWDVENPQFSVKESESVNFVVGRVKAQNRITDVSDPGLDFNIVGLNNRLSDRDPSGHFFIKTLPDGQSVDISINKVLDYETTKEFTIIIRASNRAERSGVYSDNIVKINVIDVNDVNPEFQNINPFSGKIDIYVKENSPVGSPVSAIVATDGDLTSPFNLLTYDLTGSSKDLFVIDPKNGNITTRQVFDRETVGYYFVTALAIDGSKSGRPDVTGPNTGSAAVQIIIQDVNDNSPYFEKSLYEATVKEDSFIGTTIVKIEAKDKDEINSTTFTYTLEGSSLFDVNRRTGEIRVAGNLDYEQEPNEYTLTLSVDDTFYSNKTKVKITILDTNDNPPVFTKSTYVITNITENDDYSGKPPILTVTATDPDINRAKGINYELSQGDSTITNLFSIDKQTGALRLLGKLDRDKPNGREVYQFNVLAIDEPGSGTSLTGYATIQIFPIDINDNAPIFDTSSLTGQVPEMSEVGKSVMTIKAFDYDFGENAHVTFEMVPGSQVPRDAFRLETDGSVLTTVNNLDRETNPVFTFQVKAKDNGNPQLFTTATATVNIGDINDNAPTFSQKIYATTIPETHTGRIMVISATDADINDTLNFDLIGDGNTFFSMRPEERKIGSLVRTGVLEVYKKPDYENPTERFFNLTIEVKDSDSKFKDTAYIEITVQDVNDETPIITPGSEFREKDENVPVNTILANFTATDRDVGVDNGNFDFFISGKPRNETPDFFFKIDSNGVVRVRNPLDFEKIRIHVVKILAIDRGLPPKTGTATLTVSLNNINDNDPHFFGDPKPVVMENEPPQTVITLRGADADAAPYGGPFTFALPPCAQNPTCQYFDLRYNSNGDNGKGTAVITSKVKFDREATKFYYMPIIMTDMRGHRDQSSKGRTATNTLTIEIGDVNEHKSSSGTQDIHVFNYKGLFKNIYIGSVHYEDLDDNDRGDKTFRLTGPTGASNYFQVDEVGGKVKMLAHVPTGTHKLNVDVYDTKLKNTITSYVNIKIEDLPEEAPYRSGSVRLTGITAAEFINGDNSPLVKFRNLLKSKLTPNSEVQIVSVMDTEVDNVKYCDVRYAARGSPYYQSSKLDGIVDKDRTEFQRTLPPNAKIAMVNIDMCLREICEGGGCFNKLIVKDSPNLVDAKGSSYVGVETEVQAECGCIAATNVTECSAAYCANGGTCNKDWWGVISCKCPPEFDGPRCQQTRHGFDGTGYALYQTLQQCENSVTSVEIVTRNENGLIMYNGPVRELGTMDPRDYVVLQLRNGYPELTIDHGTGSLTLTVNGKTSEGKIRMPKLNDGKWHQIDIRRQGKLVTLTVDHCLKAESVEGSAQDRSPCEARGATKGENIFLNVHSQLQLGGRYSAPSYPTNVIQTKFKGCMRNLRHNNELYDLYTKGFYAGTTDGCPEEDDACGKNSVNGPKCQNGDCQLTTFPSPPLIPGAAECVCYPGYRGTVCQYNTTVRDFNDNSFMDWELTNAFKNSLSTKELDIQLMYRSRDKDGVLFHVQAEVSTEFMKLEIIDNTVQILYNLGDGNRNLQLSDVTASDGQWHTIQVKRRGLHITFMMDGGEGSNFIETYGSSDLLHQEMTVKGDQIYAGAEVSYEHSPNIDATNPKDYEKSCMNDIRLDNAWFPMTTAENQDTNSVKLLRSVETKSDCIRNDCTPAVKAACDAVGKICRPLWGTYECVCPVHTYDVQGSCQPIDYCSQSPCHHLSTCINDINNVNGFKCQCPVGMTGTICNIAERKPVEPEDGSGWLVPVIVVSIIVVLVIAAVICYIMCRRRMGNDGDDSKFLDLEKEDYDIRENIVDYDEEGAGEDDHEGYDINRLRKPADIMSRMDNPELMATKERPLKSGPPGGHIGDFIDDRLGDADEDPDAPPYDTTREFDYEGGGSDAGSLSSLNTTTSDGDQDYDYLNEWGPKFAKLADMYNNYADSD